MMWIHSKSIGQLSALIALSLGLSACGSYNSQDLTSIFINLQHDALAIFDLTTAFCYLVGAVFCVKALFEFKTYGEQRTAMSAQHSLRGPITYLMVGIMLLYTPSTVSILSNSWLEQPVVILAYLDPQNTGKSGTWYSLEIAMFTLVQVCGLISFVRGAMMLTHVNGGPNGGMGKGIVHIVSGIIMLNIQLFLQILDNSI